jgi:hypothetical protein
MASNVNRLFSKIFVQQKSEKFTFFQIPVYTGFMPVNIPVAQGAVHEKD